MGSCSVKCKLVEKKKVIMCKLNYYKLYCFAVFKNYIAVICITIIYNT